MFSNLGSNVTVLEYGNVMMPREAKLLNLQFKTYAIKEFQFIQM